MALLDALINARGRNRRSIEFGEWILRLSHGSRYGFHFRKAKRHATQYFNK